MVPCPLDTTVEEQSDRRPVRPLTAVFMYERLKRMSNEQGLNLSPEDLLASAYLGHNLVYKAQPSVDTHPYTVRWERTYTSKQAEAPV
uniref:Uncharacterized protein n=1 Tax=Anopheles minimus TaxID=112268 RepID=A0A182VXK0_9DIPT